MPDVGFTQLVVVDPGNNRDVRLCRFVDPNGLVVAGYLSMALVDAGSAEVASRRSDLSEGRDAPGLGVSADRRSIVRPPRAAFGDACSP